MPWFPRTSEAVREGQTPVREDMRIQGAFYAEDGGLPSAPISHVAPVYDPPEQPDPRLGRAWGTARKVAIFFFDPFKTDNGSQQWPMTTHNTKVPYYGLADPLYGYQAPFESRMNMVRPEPVPTSEFYDQQVGVPMPGANT